MASVGAEQEETSFVTNELSSHSSALTVQRERDVYCQHSLSTQPPCGSTAPATFPMRSIVSHRHTADFQGREAHIPVLRNRGSTQNDFGATIVQRGEQKDVQLHCPFHFVTVRSCPSLHKYPRDLIRHLKTHKFYFCAKCSQHFSWKNEFDSHVCDRICVHLDCVNRRTTLQKHDHEAGCGFSFHDLDTPAKWYALYALNLPASEEPPWNFVCEPLNSTNSVLPSTTISPEQSHQELTTSRSFEPMVSSFGLTSPKAGGTPGEIVSGYDQSVWARDQRAVNATEAIPNADSAQYIATARNIDHFAQRVQFGRRDRLEAAQFQNQFEPHGWLDNQQLASSEIRGSYRERPTGQHTFNTAPICISQSWPASDGTEMELDDLYDGDFMDGGYITTSANFRYSRE